MVQVIPQRGGALSRLGAGIGQGLSEHLPKEFDRARLAAGLEELGKQQNLDPWQAFTKLASLPGGSPELLRSGAELLKQRAVGNALKEKASQGQGPTVNPFIKQGQTGIQSGVSPSLTTTAPIEATLESYIPKSFDQLQQRAGQLLDENPALYGNDPNKAFEAAVAEENQKKAINEALQTKRINEQNVQNNIVEALKGQATGLGANVPGNVYSDVEDKAINAVKPVEKGGEGLTEQQAKKKYGKELDRISREYKALDAVGNWSVLGRSPTENLRSINAIREDFKQRGDLENFGDTLIGTNGLSPGKAYYLAYPTRENNQLHQAITKLPDVYRTQTEDPEFETNKIVSEIASKMSKDDSPLAIAEELRAKGYDDHTWLEYLRKNRKKLDLSERQGRELDKPINAIPTINDFWLFSLIGLNKLLG